MDGSGINQGKGQRLDLELQCVEHARRWLRMNMGLVYGEVAIAADIWNEVRHFTRVRDGSRQPVVNIANGGREPPRLGDLLVYGEPYMNTGHVAVVAGTDPDDRWISVDEQNYGNRYQAPGERRHIPLVRYDERYWLLDEYLVGWKRLAADAGR